MGGHIQVPKLKEIIFPNEKNEALVKDIQLILAKAMVLHMEKLEKEKLNNN